LKATSFLLAPLAEEAKVRRPVQGLGDPLRLPFPTQKALNFGCGSPENEKIFSSNFSCLYENQRKTAKINENNF